MVVIVLLSDVKKLLIRASAVDNRVVSDLAVVEWKEIFDRAGVTDYVVAAEAVTEHFASSSEYLRPFDVVSLYRQIVARRVMSVDLPDGLLALALRAGVPVEEMSSRRDDSAWVDGLRRRFQVEVEA